VRALEAATRFLERQFWRLAPLTGAETFCAAPFA
jgi:hypothetical protein